MEKTLLIIIAAQGLCIVLSHKYYFINEKKNMKEARRYCRENYTDLASVENMEDVMTLNQMTYGTFNSWVWIGLHDDVNSWRWSLSNMSFYQDGEVDFRKWAPGEPDNLKCGEPCADMGPTGEWYDESCNEHRPAVCVNLRGPNVIFVRTENLSWSDAQSYCRSSDSLAKKQNIKLQLKTSSSLDLNDPAVMEQILNQLKQRMKDQNADVKLSWKKQPDGQYFQKKSKKNKKTRGSLCDGRH